MKRRLPFLVLVLAALGVVATLPAPKIVSGFDLATYGRLPALVDGRLKPLDTIARTSLLALQGRQRFVTPEGHTLAPSEWLLDIFYAPEKADTYRHFLIDNQEVLDLFTLRASDGDGGKRFSFVQLQPAISKLDRQAKLVDEVEETRRTPFHRQVVQLRDRVMLYQRLKYTLQSPETPHFLGEVLKLETALPAGIAAVRARQLGQPHDSAAVLAMAAIAQGAALMDQLGYLIAIPPADDNADLNAWKTPGRALLVSLDAGQIDATVLAYAALGQAWRGGDSVAFNQIVRLFHRQFEKRFAAPLAKCGIEARFNAAQPFYTSMVIYVVALLLALVSWLRWPETLGRSAFWLLVLAFALTTAGIATRMWIEGRPPVTNLYSSSVFVGWTAVALCLVLEMFFKNAIGSVAASIVGFCTLLIAHHLSLNGDTMVMMSAVLDSNFWLATHVVTITIGYGATFLAGFLAIIYIVRGVFTRSLDEDSAATLTRMVYGIVCFATLFSFVGTVLGGIWADQSWGRFWGWDPKENGALILVLWNSLILHARWGGLVRQRGLMNLAVVGNIVTAGSWFGVNMLGVGLHSYGFMDSAFYWLVGFTLSQVAIVFIAALPVEKWRSSRALAATV